MSLTILVVTSEYYRTIEIRNLSTEAGLDATIIGCFRDYHFTHRIADADIVIGDGTCKTRGDDGVSYPILFDAGQRAKKLNLPFIQISKPDRSLRSNRIRRQLKRAAASL